MENLLKRTVLIIWFLIMAFITAASLVITVNITHDMDIAFENDNIGLNILWLLIFAAAGYGLFRWRKNKTIKNTRNIFVIVTALVAIFLVAWISCTQFEVTSDQKICMDCARDLLKGINERWITGYMSVYPFQNGLVLFDALLILVFKDMAELAFQYANVLFFIIAAFAVYKSYKLAFEKSDKVGIGVWLLLILFYPFAMFVLFCYGTMIGFMFAAIAIMCLLQYFKSDKIKMLLLAAIAMSLSMFFKSNYIIVIIGMCIFLLYNALTKKSVRSFIGIVLIIGIYMLSNLGLNSLVSAITKTPVADGIPKIAWIAMGIQETSNAPGWFTNYNGYIYEKNNRDKDATVKACEELISKRVKFLVTNKRQGARFYYKKITSEWCVPDWEGINLQERMMLAQDNPLKKLVNWDNANLLKYILNIVQTIINFGILAYIVYGLKDVSKVGIYELIFAVMMIGGFILFLIWEAKSQYTLPYYYLIIPYAVLGWQNIWNMIDGIVTKKR